MSEQPEEIEVEALELLIKEQPIALYQALKLTGLVGGGQAKQLIADGYVGVNGELETRKRAKIYDQDIIEFNGEFYLVICDQQAFTEEHAQAVAPAIDASAQAQPQAKPKEEAPESTSPAQQAQQKAKTKAQGNADKRTGRKPISF